MLVVGVALHAFFAGARNVAVAAVEQAAENITEQDYAGLRRILQHVAVHQHLKLT